MSSPQLGVRSRIRRALSSIRRPRVEKQGVGGLTEDDINVIDNDNNNNNSKNNNHNNHNDNNKRNKTRSQGRLLSTRNRWIGSKSTRKGSTLDGDESGGIPSSFNDDISPPSLLNSSRSIVVSEMGDDIYFNESSKMANISDTGNSTINYPVDREIDSIHNNSNVSSSTRCYVSHILTSISSHVGFEENTYNHRYIDVRAGSGLGVNECNCFVSPSVSVYPANSLPVPDCDCDDCEMLLGMQRDGKGRFELSDRRRDSPNDGDDENDNRAVNRTYYHDEDGINFIMLRGRSCNEHNRDHSKNEFMCLIGNNTTISDYCICPECLSSVKPTQQSSGNKGLGEVNNQEISGYSYRNSIGSRNNGDMN